MLISLLETRPNKDVPKEGSAKLSLQFPLDLFADEAQLIGNSKVGGMLDEHFIAVEIAEDIAVDNVSRKDDGINEVIVEEANGQRLNLNDTIKQNKIEVRILREYDFPAQDHMIVKSTDVPFISCEPGVPIDAVELLL